MTDNTRVYTGRRVINPTKKISVQAKTENQATYIGALSNDVTMLFCMGEAGTGKTFLAVARAVEALEAEEIERIILVRPNVESGEKMGHLPGTEQDKVDPYMRPFYDALHQFLGADKVKSYIEQRIIEVSSLQLMRGRTLDKAYILLDEAQNTTCEQMKMFLTRIGLGSRMFIMGDITQNDLPRDIKSGLADIVQRFRGTVEAPSGGGYEKNKFGDIGFMFFTEDDVVRHPIIRHVLNAYKD